MEMKLILFNTKAKSMVGLKNLGIRADD